MDTKVTYGDESWHHVNTITSGSIEEVPDEVIKLLVGNRYYWTLKKTLCRERRFFRDFLSSASKRATYKGYYFVDVDGPLFEHVLRYLRHGVYPLIYDTGTGHNLSTYAALLPVAEYLGVNKLATWLREQRYFDAVTTVSSHYPLELEPGQILPSEVSRSCQSRELHFHHGSKQVYKCPKGISVHQFPAECGKKCEKAKTPDTKIWEEEDVIVVDATWTTQKLNPEHCYAHARSAV